ncbi:glycosyltransferase family 61 protein [Haloplanus aerogenes]|uniref:Capsular polysaccharide biosynthesis protein n=1 Tax=Haloplanus aerogenes TaxID=660522 RepID=A0A3M0DH62_9EURY|nr:glycosyltransferase family 61 protein [Haloplanus aerogenes]AZH26315.1 glycosyltransferase family 61 protein [Haloplanus aerogenes]RMB18226.1 capsular polysaccharide biosynthesis protein [Haloplanus aerogenes]
MELGNVPGRAYRKLRADGPAALAHEGRELLVTDLCYHSLWYDRFLHDRLDVLDRGELRSMPTTHTYDRFDGSIRYKGPGSVRHLDNPARYEPGDRFVADLPNATILGPAGPGLTADGRIVGDTVGIPALVRRRAGAGVAKSMASNGPVRTMRALRGDATPDERFGTVALAVPTWGNYYHWTVECLIRIRLLERYGAETGEYPTLVVPADRASWMDESLAMADYAGPVEGWDGGIAHADRLLVPTFPDPIPTECRWLHDRMRKAAGVIGEDDGDGADERIYVSRADATVRRVSNWSAVRRVLGEFGIEPYTLSDLNVREQITLFSRAELVVGPHGAGLTNVVYGDNLGVVELFGSKQMATFDRLAELLGYRYTAVQCQSDGLDVRVDPEQLRTTIRETLAAR